ncbi:MAG: hypothetical protein WCS73_09185 [Lentisphaeria bacterium]
MVKKKRVNLEITLVDIHIKTLLQKSQTRHILTAELVWPRVLIAQKTAQKKILLQKGNWHQPDSAPSWCERILFKETVDNTFGIRCEITAPLGALAWRKAGRIMTAGAMQIGADLLEDSFSIAGELAALPVDYLAKEIKNLPETSILVQTETDINIDDFNENTNKKIEIPLLVEHNITKTIRKGSPRNPSHTKKIIQQEGTENGSITLQIKVIP